MKYKEALNYVKESGNAASCIHRNKKEFLVIMYGDTELDYHNEIIVHYSQELSPSMGSYEVYTQDEFEGEFAEEIKVDEFTFYPCRRKAKYLCSRGMKEIREKIHRYTYGASWNHRVMASMFDGDRYFSIHEVHYDEKGEPYAYSTEPASIESENIEGLKWTLEQMSKCLDKPILWQDPKFPEECKIK